MITISLCLIVRNEQDTLERCLASVRDIVDEIVLVDTGSTDRTKEIAYRWTSKVIDYEWNDHFAQREISPSPRPPRIIFCGSMQMMY